ncbi:MAG: 4-hydroxy-tetrahydrodipicolinate synthase [Desulfobacteraceae bacterium]|nr:MAG: 4-hydroxy-tetrahydrodipicolinate synthase [Desulfobacteraceae bacterium]
MITGCFTALITPFKAGAVDFEGLERLVEFQIENGISGIVAVGTTGESPTLTWDEHNRVIDHIAGMTRNRCLCIAGTGSNNTEETLAGTRHAADIGVEAVLLIDPYYNGPSSLEIRREYYAPVAKAFPDLQIIPYVLPGRTGTQMMPQDLAILSRQFPNISTVKEATGSIENMRRTRQFCGPAFSILSGDDPMTYQMMSDPQIKASGVISVATNVAPGAIAEFIRLLNQGKGAEAEKLKRVLDPLFNIVTVKTKEQSLFGEVECRARNPLATKTLMAVLGMPAGGCRQPLGMMTRKGLETVLAAARTVYAGYPQVFTPIADFFSVDIEERLTSPACWKGLTYDEY